MGYFDGLAEASFKKDSLGRNLFFPYGALGSGFILESEEHKNKIRKFFKIIYIILLPTIIVIQIAVGFWLNLALIPFFHIWFYFTMKKITRNLTSSNEKLKIAESFKNSARSQSLAILIALEISSLVFFAAGILILVKNIDLIMGLLITAFYGLCAVVIGRMIIYKINKD